METLIKLGAIYHIALVIFHFRFWKIFNWDKELKKVSFLNRSVMQVLNLCLIFVFCVFAYVSFAHTTDLIQTELGEIILASISLLWVFRSLLQIVYFKLKTALSWAFLIYFLIGALIYSIPLLA